MKEPESTFDLWVALGVALVTGNRWAVGPALIGPGRGEKGVWLQLDPPQTEKRGNRSVFYPPSPPPLPLPRSLLSFLSLGHF